MHTSNVIREMDPLRRMSLGISARVRLYLLRHCRAHMSTTVIHSDNGVVLPAVTMPRLSWGSSRVNDTPRRALRQAALAWPETKE